ncbi:MAG: formate transporter FocA [Armatimonadetes bacterium]|nr:formate transporter FocA [Armatimonadota bacterium]NIM24221.1 formate transporter FocA [Armatimonadota bacterium]NIM68090.1 formate transporter FocA [Armatimonadota bacterium]NIM76552.1 formate transporter FocA [Armatimonadota bacterium]NIN06295.1 formate transporter FocA [Armatimonadota bacterium]
MAEIFGFDAYSPKQIFQRVESVGVTKARLPFLSMVTLGVLAGGFIGLGAMYFTVLTSDPTLCCALSRMIGGLSFSLGLILVVVAGAELFTGNNLLVMAWASKKISTFELLKNWAIIWVTNFGGAFGLALLVVLSHQATLDNGAVGVQAVKIASAKVSLPFAEAFFRGALCNLLVCLAIWLCMAGRSVTDRILAIIFPISAFVAAGFEHSVANMYFIPLGILLKSTIDPGVVANTAALNWQGFLRNIVPVTLGNILGGAVMVALVYHIVYRPGKEDV